MGASKRVCLAAQRGRWVVMQQVDFAHLHLCLMVQMVLCPVEAVVAVYC